MPADPSSLSTASKAKYYLSNLLLRGLIGGAGLIPYRWRVPAMGRLVRLLAPLAGYHRRIRKNLAMTCPDLPPQEVRRICRDVCDNAGRVVAELYAGEPFLSRARAAACSGPGLAALEKARREGRPAVIVTGHFGNYDAGRASLLEKGYNLGALYRRMANPYFNEHYVAAIEATGKPMFEQGRRGMVELVRHLRGGGTLAILTDLHVQGGEIIDFFGQPAMTSTVPAELALKYNAALVPVYAKRKENGLDFEIVFNAEIPHTDPVTMIQAVTDDLEAMVRQHMGQWFWIHRRWKVPARKQPAAEAAPAG